MNIELQKFARETIKEGLAKLNINQKVVFKRMYSPSDLEADINTVVDNMPEEKLNWAMTQVKNTLDKQC